MQQCVRGQTESKISFCKSYIQFFYGEKYIYVHVRINFIGAQNTERIGWTLSIINMFEVIYFLFFGLNGMCWCGCCRRNLSLLLSSNRIVMETFACTLTTNINCKICTFWASAIEWVCLCHKCERQLGAAVEHGVALVRRCTRSILYEHTIKNPDFIKLSTAIQNASTQTHTRCKAERGRARARATATTAAAAAVTQEDDRKKQRMKTVTLRNQKRKNRCRFDGDV